jgi:methyl-accepting chemotaxis protein
LKKWCYKFSGKLNMSILFRPADWPVAVKLLVAFLFIALTPLLVVGLLSQNQAREGLLAEARRNLINTSSRTSKAVDDFLQARVTDLQQTATLDSVTRFLQLATEDRGSLGPGNFDQSSSFNILKSKSNSLLVSGSYLALASGSGIVELTSNSIPNQEGQPIEGELRNVADQTYFKEAMQNRTYISNPRLVNFSDRAVSAVVYVSAPVRNQLGNPIGAVILRFNMDSIWQIVNNDFEAVGRGSYGMLIDDTNQLGIRIADSRIKDNPDAQTRYLFGIVRPYSQSARPQWVNSGRFPDNFDIEGSARNQDIPGLVNRLGPAMPTDANARIFETRVPEFGKEREGNPTLFTAQAGYSQLSTKPTWYYFVVVPETSYAAAANGITLTLVVVLVVAILAVLALAYFLSRLLTRPVRSIGRVLGRIGMGDFEARVPVTSQDELGRLGESLNAMFDNTLTLIQSREEKEVLQERITHLLEEISTVAEGDLTVQAEVTADITGAIADSFNLMIDELRKIIINIQTTTAQANVFFDDAVVNFQQSEKVFNRQAQQVGAVTGAVAEIDRSIQRVSESATISAEVAQEARRNARQGNDSVVKTISGMNRIRGNVQETSKKIKRLGESSQQISEIVKLIDDIADQTNMLALNAAIQAAMAGEQGKGFSVVSEEVRRLAERSANATREIAALVKSIQDDTTEAIVAMEESTREVVDGSQLADEAGRALSQIETVVDRLADLITNISQVSRQQAASSTNIARNMSELSKLTDEAATLRRQSAEAVQTVASTAEELRRSVSAFKVNTENELSPMDALPAGVGAGSVNLSKDDFQYGDSVSPNGGSYYPVPPSVPTNDYRSYMPPVTDIDMPPNGSSMSSYPVDGNGNGSNYPFPNGNGNGNGNGANGKPTAAPARSHNDPFDFDLSSLLDDDTFDSLFDSSNPNGKSGNRDGRNSKDDWRNSLG